MMMMLDDDDEWFIAVNDERGRGCREWGNDARFISLLLSLSTPGIGLARRRKVNIHCGTVGTGTGSRITH